MGDLGKELLGAAVDGVHDGLKHYLDEAFYKGYDRATDFCIGYISQRIDTLRGRIKDGKFLSKEEQYLMVYLEELQNEIENELPQFRENRTTRVARVVRKDNQ